MKKILLLMSVMAVFVACEHKTKVDNVKYDLAANYSFKNYTPIPANPIAASQGAFDSLYIPTRTMGEKGKPTEIDFEKQFVIGIVMPDTCDYIKIIPGQLSLNNDTLTLHYTTQMIEKNMTWTMQPMELLVVNRKYLATNCVLVKDSI